MKLGVMFANTSMGLDFDEIGRLVVGLEDAGFDTFSSNDHVIGGHPDRSEGVMMNTVDTAVHEPIVLLSMIAAVTRRIELTTAILIAPQRQTVLLAKQTAQLDLLSKGRLRLGLGVGRNWIEYESLREDFATRGKRMEEQVEVLRLLWSEELVSYHGRFHQLDRVGINPRSERGRIPIWMGCYFKSVSEVVLERIGRVADGWMPQFPPDVLAPVLGRVRGYARDSGRDPSELAMECGILAKPSDKPEDWVRTAADYQRLGATHLKVMPRLGPESSTDERLDLARRWYEAVEPEVR